MASCTPHEKLLSVVFRRPIRLTKATRTSRALRYSKKVQRIAGVYRIDLSAPGVEVVREQLTKNAKLPFHPERISRKDKASEFVWTLYSALDHQCRRILSEGILLVGVETAWLLACRFGTLDRLANASEDDLRAVDGIGSKTAWAIAEHFRNKRNRDRVERLRAELGKRRHQPSPTHSKGDKSSERGPKKSSLPET